MRALRQQTKRLFACAFPVAAAVFLTACSADTQGDENAVVARLTGIKVEDRGVLTSHYSRAELGGQTRAIAKPDANHAGTRIHFSDTVDLKDAKRIDFAYGLDSEMADGARVSITATLRAGGRTVKIVDADLTASGDSRGRWIEVFADVAIDGDTAELEIQSYVSPSDAGEVYVSQPVATKRAPGAPRLPNLLLISLDTLRSDRVGAYGYERDTTPNMDRRFGENGLVVDRVFSGASDTVHGHTAMFLAREPCTAITPMSGRRWGQHPGMGTLAEALAHAGYRTAAFTENAMVNGAWGFARGFDLYDEETHAEREGETIGFAEQTFGRGLAWLERTPDDAPFFLFLHTYQVHAPYTPPPGYEDLFPTPEGSTTARAESDEYDRELRFTDDQVERVFKALEDSGQLENTLVVVTSDHGEEFGEHGGRYHGFQLYDSVLRVPLMLHGPGVPRGERAAGPMALVDLTPTLIDMLGADHVLEYRDAVTMPGDPPPNSKVERRLRALGYILDGRSMAEHFAGRAPARGQNEPIFAQAKGEFRFTYEGATGWLRPAYAAVAWPLKLYRHRTAEGRRYELFDLEKDPGEKLDVFSERREEAQPLVDDVEIFFARCEASLLKLRHAVAGPGNAPVDKRREDKLRALGYIE